ncbi:S8 family serine peptidase [filamentous cyanobacterium LEGE 11480]|uniref:S8 family serine peptidase n=1 Tax=Romeriopsis navalis LEGE 11480 TaxID=2777977 RepID=A0A928Z3Z3_9CYAN|nr:S8 family serine peptidase [Romeriopsis navalis]MBE9029793.1 S8 family serine peptidase [Romeriopsis navalis LEGE 11480]
MPYVSLGKQDEPAFELVESRDLIAVRTRSHRSVRGAGPVSPPAAAAVQDGNLVANFPEAGVEVYQVPASAQSLDNRKQTLRVSPDVQFAGSVLVYPGTQEPVLYTENFYIRFREELDTDDCEAIIRQAGLTVKRELGFATNAYFAAAPEGTGQQVFTISQDLLQRDEVIYCHPELVQQRSYKAIFPEQWHLKPTTVGGVAINAHANVEAAHAITRGSGVTIAVIDSGIDIDHPEFQSSGKIVAPRDTTLRIDNPRPKDPFPFPSRRSSENHGTACAGVACADGQEGASGVAPQAKLMPMRLASGLSSMQEAEAFRWAADNGADIISCSWGPPDGDWWNLDDPRHNRVIPLLPSSRDAIDYAITNGRGGKGCVICWAAGNGNESADNDGYASYEKVIAVAACNDRSKRSVYSDFGKAVWCTFPSNDFGSPPLGQPEPLTPGIWTTDRQDRFGYNPGLQSNGTSPFGSPDGHYTNDFGGTSSACPGVAGVAALMLAVNPDLRWNEVKDLMKQSCDRIDPQGGQYDVDGHSEFYGYGRLNAETAVKLAKDEIIPLVIVNKLVNRFIPDLGTVEETIEATESIPVSKLAIYVKLEHTYIGDLVITAIPPVERGLETVVLHNRSGGNRDNLEKLFDPSNTPKLAVYSGKQCHGRWTLRVEDNAVEDAGTLIQISIQQFLAVTD